MLAVLAQRKADLVVVLENVVDPHNIGAVMRSADSVGVQEIFVINAAHRPDEFQKKRSSGSAELWLIVHEFNSVKEAVEVLRKRNFKLMATHLGAKAVSLYEVNMCQPVALVFGGERHGLSDELLSYCDENFIIPQYGMIKSLNISVACALSLYEANRQRLAQTKYQSTVYSESQKQEILSQWCKRYESDI